jgi:hypothetical protein
VRTVVADAGAERLRDPKAEPSANWRRPVSKRQSQQRGHWPKVCRPSAGAKRRLHDLRRKPIGAGIFLSVAMIPP